MQALFLAMALYPEVQKKAQAEIDAVVGPDRLPEFEDRPSLPYIDAVIKELLRWNLVAPLGEPFYIYHIVLLLGTILTFSLKLSPTWLLTTMNIMVTIFQKGQLCLAIHGELQKRLNSYFLP